MFHDLPYPTAQQPPTCGKTFKEWQQSWSADIGEIQKIQSDMEC